MTDSVLNRILARPPAPGHHLRVVRLGSDRTVDLREVWAAAGRLAAALAAEGIAAGDRIGILAGNGLDWVLLDLAALRLKAVTAGFEPGKFEAGPELLERYDLKLLFTDRPAGGDQPAIRSITEVAQLSNFDGDVPAARWERGEATTIKFTSGSTGEPKGLGASAGSIDASLRAVQEMFTHGPGDDIFVFLPLSLLQQRYWIYSALAYGHDVTVSSYEAAFATMRTVRPSVVMGVPGFFETARRHITDQAGRRGLALDEAGRQLFGDRIRYLWTGSAPASPTVLEFFDSIGLPIFEGYGLNETCIVSKNHPGASRRGSVGRVLPGKQVLFDDDGVVSVRSDDPVGLEYTYAGPGDSERVFGPDGVVRTGDIGHLDADGFLYILGRADDVIVLENGRKVIVRPIEERLCAGPAIDQAVVFCPAEGRLAAVVSPAAGPVDTAVIAAQLNRANAAATRDEQVVRVVVAAEPFSIGNGLLTGQYKPRRARIFEQYRTAITAKGDGVHVY
jgi:long-subunit acyl-CoA synthetase (AMP-forming)